MSLYPYEGMADDPRDDKRGEYEEAERLARQAFANDQEWIDNEMWKDGDMRTFCLLLIKLARESAPSHALCSHDWSRPAGFETKKCNLCGVIEPADTAPSTTPQKSDLAKALLELAENPDEVCGQFARGAMRRAASALSATLTLSEQIANRIAGLREAQHLIGEGSARADWFKIEERISALINNSPDGGKQT